MTSKKEAWKPELYSDAVRDKIEEFVEKGVDAIPEEERDKWFTRFKFWGVFQQRTSQNPYFMMRLADANGVLEPGQLRAIGEVARDYASDPVENPEFGDAWVDLTTRQSIQLHWLELEDIPEIWERLEAAGVSSRFAGGDTIRNITGCPVAGRDKHELVESQPLLDRFQEDLRGNDALSNMPRKLNISVTGCREGCVQDSINDVGFEPATKEIDGETVTGFSVRVGGGLDSRRPRATRNLDIFAADEERAYEVVHGFVELYHRHGNRNVQARARSHFFVDEWGMEKIRDLLREGYIDFELRSAGENIRDEYTYNVGRPESNRKHDHIDVHEQANGDYYVGLSVAVGRLTASDAIELTDVADEYGSGGIRPTRRQNPF